MSAYESLKQRWQKAGRINQAASVLNWDQSVMMPSGGAAARAEQMAALATYSHELLTDAAIEGELGAAQAESLNDWDARNLELMAKQFAKSKSVPADLVSSLSTAQSAAEQAWGKARDANDFAIARDALATVFDLTRQRAEILSQKLELDPYDVLLDDFEPGLKAERVDTVFADYEAFLPDFLKEVQAKQAAEPAILMPEGPFDTADQEAFGRRVVEQLGFDFSRGRLDVSRHPFCGGYPSDVRITTRYDEADFTTALMGLIHETGHALYESGLPEAYAAQPVGAAAGMAAHESQSLLMEMQAGRSDAYLSHLVPALKAHFKGQGAAWELDNLQRLYRKVEPGLVRVDADEVTYPAHVIMRYELEKALFAGDLAIDDLPLAFAEGLDARLGVRPQTDFEGALQDIHWYFGGFGYFPTYTLGAMAAAQLFAAAKRALPGLDQDLARGDFTALVGWLAAEIHGKGSLLTTDELLTSATGEPLNAALFQQHLRQRYLGDA